MTRLSDRRQNRKRQVEGGRPVPAQRGLASPQPASPSPAPASGGNCPALWHRTSEWNELKAWILSREANRSSFYLDLQGLVTIGIGHLVDQGSATRTIASRHRAGREFSNAHHALLRTRAGGTVSPAQVYSDWLAVLNRTRTSGLLRLRPGAAARLFELKTRRYAQAMYQRFPFSNCLPATIQMAIIDVRFNASGTNPFRSHSAIPLWNALDRSRQLFNNRSTINDYDPMQALALFRSLWNRPSSPVYQNRHLWRVRHFEAGVAQMLAEDQNRFDTTIQNLNR